MNDVAPPPLELYLPDPAATERLGVWFASRLRAGDCLLLEGPIGAGKSLFARSLIQSRLGRAEDVPSPTFTLVQTYEADLEIWHADLYRLSHPEEVFELGLEGAFDTGICLIEWPDRLGRFAPGGALRLDAQLRSQYRFRAFEIFGQTQLGIWEYQGVPTLTQSPIGASPARPNSLQP